MSPPMDGVRRRRPLGLALTLMLAPYGLAFLLLVVGLFGSLAWIYLSIAVSVLGVPLFAIAVYLLTRRPAAVTVAERYRFNAPPGWPTPPVGWTPPPGWQPDPSWPTPPADWQWWSPADHG